MEVKQKVKINLGTFDLIKGIAMLDIIFTHMRYRYEMEQLFFLMPVYFVLGIMASSLMPMFFIISGFGFKEKTGRKMLKKTFSELIIPYLWSILIYIVFFFCMYWPVFDSKSQFLKQAGLQISGFLLGLPVQKTVFGYDVATAGALWFFLALFTAENILNLIVKFKRTTTQLALAGLCVLTGFVLLRLDFVLYCIPQGLIAVGFCYTGVLLKKHKLLERGVHSKWTYIILVPVFLIQALTVILSGSGFSMVGGTFNLLECVLVACSGLLLIFLGVLCNKYKNRVLNWIRKIGMHSYWIIIIHTVETLAVPWDVMAAELSNQPMMFVVEVGLKILIITTGCEMIKKISQIRYKKRMEKNGKIRSHQRSGSPVCQ